MSRTEIVTKPLPSVPPGAAKSEALEPLLASRRNDPPGYPETSKAPAGAGIAKLSSKATRPSEMIERPLINRGPM